MPVKRVLADCVVLSLQDSSVFYPSCRGCFSKIDVGQQDETRCRCCKCGYSCSRELVDYRYRLSVWATRDGCIFGITVFGTCLNPLFGTHASGFKRLLEIPDGPIVTSTRSTLLMRAVEDCFIGRHFLFGIKLSDTEQLPWVGITATKNSCRSTGKVQVIASQMIPPQAPLLGGCTVVSYYQILLQKSAECELQLAESSTYRPPRASPLLKRHHAEAGGFEHDASGFFSLSLQRTPKHRDSTLSPTPPFQQSPGLVTSSAEQEFCTSKDSEDGNNSQTGEFHTPRPSRRRSPGPSSDSGSVLTPLSFSSPLAPNCSDVTFGGESGNISSVSSCSNFPPAGNVLKATGFSTIELSEPSLAGSVVWDDLPFSESLSKFLYGENMVVNDRKNDQEPEVENQVETPENVSKSKSQERNLTAKSTLLPWMSGRRSQTLMNITNTGHLANDYHEVPVQMRSITRRPSKNLTFEEQNLEDAKKILLDDEREEAFGRNSFNFSADLFSSSLVNNVTANAQTETFRRSFPQLGAESQKSPKSEIMKEMFVPADIQDLDFVPPSQSTPIVRGTVAPYCSYRPNRIGHRFHPKWSFGRVGEDKNQLLSPRHVGIRLDSPSVGSTDRSPHRRDSGCSDLTACDYADSRDAIFPTTPVAKTKQIRRAHISVDLGRSWEEHRTPKTRVGLIQAPSGCHSQTGSCERRTIVKGGLGGWNDDSCVCNYSRDLFSDSL